MLDDKITFRHTDYDFPKATVQIRQTDYPQAEDFAKTNALNVPSESSALEMLTQLEAKQTKK